MYYVLSLAWLLELIHARTSTVTCTCNALGKAKAEAKAKTVAKARARVSGPRPRRNIEALILGHGQTGTKCIFSYFQNSRLLRPKSYAVWSIFGGCWRSDL